MNFVVGIICILVGIALGFQLCCMGIARIIIDESEAELIAKLRKMKREAEEK